MTNWIDDKINETVKNAVAEVKKDLDTLLNAVTAGKKELSIPEFETIIYKVNSVIDYLTDEVRKRYEHDRERPF